jgi:Uma2 family endonuclease
MSEVEYERWAAGRNDVEWVNGTVEFKGPTDDQHDEAIEFVPASEANERHDAIRGLLLCVMSAIVKHTCLGRVRGLESAMREGDSEATPRHHPDVLFISHEQVPLSHVRLQPAPDLVIEVVSPDSQLRDYHQKYAEYEQAGVREYWIVNPMSQTVNLLVRDPAVARLADPAADLNRFVGRDTDGDGRLHSTVIPGFWLRPRDLFANPRPSAIDLLREIAPDVLA